MDIANKPELLDLLASHYALGTLRGGARRRFQALARERAKVRASALIWESRLSSLNELQTQVQPSPVVWTRIHNLIQAELDHAKMQAARQKPAAASGMAQWWRSLALWRSAAAAGVLATVIAMMNLHTAPTMEYVAVLSDDQAAASMLVTFDPNKKQLTLQRVGNYREAGDRSLQLWALQPGAGPRSLGVLGSDKVLHLTAAGNEVRNAPVLAISLEPKGGVPSETGPTGPVLFKGALIQKVL
jgi:anti-sigma-K factor RskA